MAFSARMRLLEQATIADPATISLADVGEYFTSDNVEAALQETGAQLAQKANIPITGNARGTNATDFQFVRTADDQVASGERSFIAGGAYNEVSNYVARGGDASDSFAEGKYNRAHDCRAHAEGHGTLVDGKNSHAENNGCISSGNDSHAEGNRTVTGRRYYGGEVAGIVTTGSEDAGDGLGVLEYVLIPATEGDLTSHFPNLLTDNVTTRYGAGASADTKGNIYPSGMTPAVWTGDTPTTLNDLQWALHSICIVRGLGEINYEFINIAKAVYSAVTGTKVYYTGSKPFTTIIGIYTSYAPTVYIDGVRPGNSQHSEGFLTSAWGYGSHAEGLGSIAWAETAHAEGYYTKALGPYSHAEGENTEAFGRASRASGYESKAKRIRQISHAVGKITAKGDNQLTYVQYTRSAVGAGWHLLHALAESEAGKAYNIETMVIGRQIAGAAAGTNIGDTFAYKFTVCFVKTADAAVLLGATRTLIGRTATMTGDGLATGVRMDWGDPMIGDFPTYGHPYFRIESLADTTFQITAASKIQEMGL